MWVMDNPVPITHKSSEGTKSKRDEERTTFRSQPLIADGEHSEYLPSNPARQSHTSSLDRPSIPLVYPLQPQLEIVGTPHLIR
ncbi:jg21846 [Pararge aegeria aegeria]|uniref:Jg21846 protein n=1 Tax=Pararge aegeria aegeria TaxID=348720 RepID=A0A8S4SRC5_9NEOP|nr:jg21846 [Pararge aegeria aegeria]